MLKAEEQNGTKILLEAISQDKVHLARFVLDALDGEIVDSKTETAQTPLISSILLPDAHTRCKFVELLLQRGASVNGQDGNGRTALSHACEKGHLDAVRILVRNSADPEIADVWGNSALMYAAVADHAHIVEFLVRAFKRLGLQINRQNKVGNSAAHVATLLGHTECLFALSNKVREAEGGAQGNAQLRHSVGRGDVNTCHSKVRHLVNKLEALGTSCPTDSVSVQNRRWQPGPRMKRSPLPSMDSIDEFETENDDTSWSRHELVFSRPVSPKPPVRTSDLLTPSKQLKPLDTVSGTNGLLPPLISSSESKNCIFFSPRPRRITSKPDVSSALNILLTPIDGNKSEGGSRTDKWASDFSVPKFHHSYYEKRLSLPTTVLSPAPPERTVVPLRKSRTVRMRTASPCGVKHVQINSPTTATSPATFSAFSHKLLRRFTSPEFKNDGAEPEQDPEFTSVRILRSETFPQDLKHPLVGNKPSIDSISSVKCEFDFQSRMPNS